MNKDKLAKRQHVYGKAFAKFDPTIVFPRQINLFFNTVAFNQTLFILTSYTHTKDIPERMWFRQKSLRED